MSENQRRYADTETLDHLIKTRVLASRYELALREIRAALQQDHALLAEQIASIVDAVLDRDGDH